MLNDALTRIVKYAAMPHVKWNSPPYARSAFHMAKPYFTLRRSISLAEGEFRWKKHFFRSAFFWWGMVDSDHRSQWQQIYSLPPLAAREIPHMVSPLSGLIWSWWSESNQQPADYKSAALPLSHTSELFFCERFRFRNGNIISQENVFVKPFLKNIFYFFFCWLFRSNVYKKDLIFWGVGYNIL